MAVESVLQRLRLNANFMQQVVAWERLPARPPRYGDAGASDPAVRQALDKLGYQRLYTHQSAAIEALRDGANVVIATATASGKSLCYTIPVMERLRAQPQARALYLFPTKALTQDQLSATQAFNQAGKLGVAAGVFDGDTPRGKRSTIRRDSRIILTNPDMLHAGILPFHTGWRDLFANLAYIVIDEVHTYRGVFGSHVANVLRRLLRLCAFYGSRPQFICCSATIANPQAHAERLYNAPFTLIDEAQNGAPQGAKHFILFNPPLIDAELGLRESLILTATEAAATFIKNDVQTVVFARSRQSVELMLGYLRDVTPAGVPEAAIAGYRGGYLPLERRAIEQGLRSGDVRGVVATNALELGIDIGALEAAVLAGYPGSIASIWQQAGRAGRRDAPSAVLLIAGNNPIDQYICRNPHYLFGRSPENALINPDNLPISMSHLLCAAFELPFGRSEQWGSLGAAEELLPLLSATGDLHASGDRFHWIGEGTPSAQISLRTSGTDNVIIQTQRDGRPDTVGEVERFRAPVTVYEDAIYLHAGQAYLIEQLDWDGQIAQARPVEVDYYTRAGISSDIRALRPAAEQTEHDVLHAHGEVLVVSQATSYRKVRRYTHETLGIGPIELPPWELDTTGYWLVLGEALAERLFADGILQRPNDYGPNWQQQRQAALARDNYRCRTCGLDGQQSGAVLHVHHIRPFKEYGYRRGENDHYLIANRLDNLVTLCPGCHMRAEASVQTRSALGGLAYVLRNLAPLFLMCDSSDIQVSGETRNALTNAPTVVIYETTAGVGFAEKLYELHGNLLRAAYDLIGDCGCCDGCPACVGPPGEIGPDTKQVTRRLLRALIAAE